MYEITMNSVQPHDAMHKKRSIKNDLSKHNFIKSRQRQGVNLLQVPSYGTADLGIVELRQEHETLQPACEQIWRSIEAI